MLQDSKIEAIRAVMQDMQVGIHKKLYNNQGRLANKLRPGSSYNSLCSKGISMTD